MKTREMNIAFFDSEFTANTAENKGVQELIQCAFIVHKIEVSDDGVMIKMSNPIKVYKTYVQPTYNKKLSNYIKGLTGIEQQDVERGKSFSDTINDLYQIVKDFEVIKIVVWGPDKYMLKNNFDVLDYNKIIARLLLDMFVDISHGVSNYFGYSKPLAQHRVCEMMHIEESGVLHDAYSDALNLSKLVNGFCGFNIRNQ